VKTELTYDIDDIAKLCQADAESRYPDANYVRPFIPSTAEKMTIRVDVNND
jgi:hypothetical protein